MSKWRVMPATTALQRICMPTKRPPVMKITKSHAVKDARTATGHAGATRVMMALISAISTTPGSKYLSS